MASPYFKTTHEVLAGYQMAFANAGIGYFLSLPASLHNVCPLARTAATDELEDHDHGHDSHGGNSKLQAGAIAGIAVACVVALACLTIAAVMYRRYSKLRRDYDTLQSGPDAFVQVGNAATKIAV